MVNAHMSALLLPLPQSEEYARALRLVGLEIRCMTQTHGSAESLRWQIQSRRFGRFGAVDLLSRGPVGRDGTMVTDWLYDFQRWQAGRPLILNAGQLDGADLRAAGFWPLVTPASIALLPLCQPSQMRRRLAQKWRNRLNRAESQGLRVRQAPLSQGHWLLKAETAQARQRGYRGLPAQLSLAFAQANPGAAQVWEVAGDGGPLAGVLMLRHGRMATWQMGHVTAEGRRRCAMNLLLWSAIQGLAEAGHDCLDLGMINTEDAPGLSHFKLGTGARLVTLGGTWLHSGALAPIARRLPMVLAA